LSEKKKIICRLVGGIGNQLFSYAAARRLSIVNDAELVLDTVSGFKYDYIYKRSYQLSYFNVNARLSSEWERFEPFPNIRRYLFRELNKKRNFFNRSYIRQEGINYDPRLLEIRSNKNIYIEGYWQSEKYFKDIEETLRKDLIFNTNFDLKNKSMSEQIKSKNSVAVHIRFFDSTIGMHNLPIEYYEAAIFKLNDIVVDPHFFIFSDNADIAFKIMKKLSKNITIVNINDEKNAYLDLWLMSLCRHFIIANSTFSWWGAWLSKNVNKLIISPDFEINHKNRITSWGFEGLIPEDWIKISVKNNEYSI
jgi:hypothetical protein